MRSNVPQLAVGAICVRAGRLLVVQRGRRPAVGRWSVPGGRVEAGEHLRAAVLRELGEETGLTGRVGALCGAVERIGEDRHYVILDYWVDVPHGEPHAGDDAASARWASRSELDRLPLVDGLLDFLEEHGVLGMLDP